MPRRAPISVPGIASSASRKTFSFDETGGGLQDQRGAEHGAVEDLENAAALILGPAAHACPQGRKRARQAGKAAEDAAGKSDTGVGDAAAEPKGHRLADEIERGRKHQQHHADAELEVLRIGARDQQRPDRHAERGRRPRTARASLKSSSFHIDGNVEICELTEQIRTIGTATAGGRM